MSLNMMLRPKCCRLPRAQLCKVQKNSPPTLPATLEEVLLLEPEHRIIPAQQQQQQHYVLCALRSMNSNSVVGTVCWSRSRSYPSFITVYI